MPDNRHFDRLFHDIVRAGITIEIDNYIHMCELNAGVATEPHQWLERADEYRKTRNEALLQRQALLLREQSDEYPQ